MFSPEELRWRFDAYADARISRAEFYDWFEANSYDAYEDSILRPVCVAIDTALSEYLFDDIGEDALKEELAKAIRPFASEFADIDIRFLPDPLVVMSPEWDVPNNLYLDYPSQQYPLFAQARVSISWVPPHGTSTAVSEPALPSQRVYSAASASRPVRVEAVAE